MSWVRIDDGYHRHPKVRAAGLHGRALHLAGLCWCSANLTDGFVPTGMLPLIAVEAQVRVSTVNQLVTIGLWIPKENGWLIHDYLDYQRDAESVRAERAAAKERQRRAREAAAERRAAGDASRRDIRRDSRCDNGVSHGPPDPTRPDPSTSNHQHHSKSVGGQADGGGGGDFDQRLHQALELAVDAAERREPRPPAKPAAWRAAVRTRIDREHGAAISQAIKAGATPETAAAIANPEPEWDNPLKGKFR